MQSEQGTTVQAFGDQVRNQIRKSSNNLTNANLRPQSAKPPLQYADKADKLAGNQMKQYSTISRRLNSTSTPVDFETFKTLHEQQAKKLQRQLNQIENENRRKQKELELQRTQLEQQKQLILLYQKFDTITQLYDVKMEQSSPENIMKAIHKSPMMMHEGKQYKSSTTAPEEAEGSQRSQGDKDHMENSEQDKGQRRLIKPKSVVNSTTFDKNNNNQGRLSNQLKKSVSIESQKNNQDDHERDAERDASFDQSVFEKVNMDIGIANFEFQPSKLLQKKLDLIQQLKDSRLKYFQQQYEKQQYLYIHQRFESQLNYELAMIRELDPYFKFQAKINPNLISINNGREQRIKIYDQKMRQMKQQIRDKKSFMAQQLRQKCNELAELEKMNKKQKTKMIGGSAAPQGNQSQQRNADESHDDSRSKKDKSASKYDAESHVNKEVENVSRTDPQNQSSIHQLDKQTSKIHKHSTPMQETSCYMQDGHQHIVAKMENALDLYKFMHQSKLLKQFILCQKKLKGLNIPADVRAVSDEIREVLKAAHEERQDFRDRHLRIEHLLSQKVKGAKGYASLKNAAASSNPANAPMGEKQLKMQKYLEGEKLSEEMLAQLKSDIDEIFNLKNFLNDEDQNRINELNSDCCSDFDDQNFQFPEDNEGSLSNKSRQLQLPTHSLQKSRRQSQFLSVKQNSLTLSQGRSSKSKLPQIKEKSKKGRGTIHSRSHSRQQYSLNNNNQIATRSMSSSQASNYSQTFQMNQTNRVSDQEEIERAAETDRENYQKSRAPLSRRGKRHKNKSKSSLRRARLLEKVEAADRELGLRLAQKLEMRRQWLLLQEVKASTEFIISSYNKQQAQDAIKELEYHELSEDLKEKKKHLENMENEVEKWKQTIMTGKQITSINDKEPEDECRGHRTSDEIFECCLKNNDEDEQYREQKAAKEREMFDWVLMRYSKQTGGKVVGQFRQRSLKEHLQFGSKNNLIRMFLNKKLEIQKKKGFTIYDIETMEKEHDKYRQLVVNLRKENDRIRLQCKESTNQFAFRIHCIFDASDIEYPDSEIETIIKRYSRFWPFEHLDYDDQDHQQQHNGQSSQQIMKNLDKFEAQKRRQSMKTKKKMLKKGLTDFQVKMMNTSLWQAFLHKIETNMYFLHQKKFLVFLIQQIKLLRKPIQTQFLFTINKIGGGNPNKSQLLKAHREVLSHQQFQKEYKRVIDVNKQNLKEVKQGERRFQDTPQEAIIIENQGQQEEKYFQDVYIQNHYAKKQAYEQKIQEQLRLEALKKRRIKVIHTKLADKKLSGFEKVLHAVNQDKSQFRKLIDYDRQDTMFIQNFMQNVNEAQQSEMLKVPHQATLEHQMHGHECLGANKNESKRSETLLKPTQASLMKQKDSKEEVVAREQIIRERLESKRPRLMFSTGKNLSFKKDEKGSGKSQRLHQSASEKRISNQRANSLYNNTAQTKRRVSPVNFQSSDLSSRDQLTDAQESIGAQTPKPTLVQRNANMKFKKIQLKQKNAMVPQTATSSYDKMEQLFQDKIQKVKKKSKRKNNRSQQRVQKNQDINGDISFERPRTSILKNSKLSLRGEAQGGQDDKFRKTNFPVITQSDLVTPDRPKYLKLKEEALESMQELEHEQPANNFVSSSHYSMPPNKRNGTDEVLSMSQSQNFLRNMVHIKLQAQTDIRPRKQWYLAASDEQYADLNSDMLSSAYRLQYHPTDNSIDTYMNTEVAASYGMRNRQAVAKMLRMSSLEARQQGVQNVFYNTQGMGMIARNANMNFRKRNEQNATSPRILTAHVRNSVSLNSDFHPRNQVHQGWNRRSFDSNLTSFVHPAAAPEVQKCLPQPQYLTQNNFFNNTNFQHFSSTGNIQPAITELTSNLSRSIYGGQNQGGQSMLKQSTSTPLATLQERKKIKIKKIKIPKLKDNKQLNDLLKDIK